MDLSQNARFMKTESLKMPIKENPEIAEKITSCFQDYIILKKLET